MGYLIDKIRSWFCKHEWECVMEAAPVYEDFFVKMPAYFKWVYVCKKCKCRKIVKSQ